MRIILSILFLSVCFTEYPPCYPWCTKWTCGPGATGQGATWSPGNGLCLNDCNAPTENIYLDSNTVYADSWWEWSSYNGECFTGMECCFFSGDGVISNQETCDPGSTLGSETYLADDISCPGNCSINEAGVGTCDPLAANSSYIYYTKWNVEEISMNIWKVSPNDNDSTLVLDLEEDIILFDISQDGNKLIIHKIQSQTTSIYHLIDLTETVISTDLLVDAKFGKNEDNIICISENNKLLKYNINLDELTILADSLQRECWFDFSPDMGKIVYYEETDSDVDNVVILDLNTLEQTIIAINAYAGHDFGNAIAWTHNDKIFYESHLINDTGGFFRDVIRVNLDGTDQQSYKDIHSGYHFFQPANQLTPSEDESIALIGIDQNGFALYQSGVEMDDLTLITELTTPAFTLIWSTDNSSIYYSTSTENYPCYIYGVDVETGNKTYLGSGFFPVYWIDIDDCAGVPNGSNVIDNCGICDSDSSNDCVQDCAGTWGGTVVKDECGVCNGVGVDAMTACCSNTGAGLNGEVADCAGICGGDAVVNDECGECGVPGTTCLYLYNGLIPEDFNIHSIYPNPFNPITNIIYGIPEYTNVQIIVYDLSGKQIKTLVNQFQTPGYHSVDWNADNHPSGVYFVKMIAGEYVNTQKLMLIK